MGKVLKKFFIHYFIIFEIKHFQNFKSLFRFSDFLKFELILAFICFPQVNQSCLNDIHKD